MSDRVMIIMNNKNAVISTAMMTTQWEHGNNDFIDIIIPFILNVLADKKNKYVVIIDLKKELSEEFGLELPSNILEVILKRLCKQGYLSLSNKLFQFTDKTIDVQRFNKFREELSQQQQYIIDLLRTFIRKNEGIDVSQEETETRLVNYLGMYGFSFFRKEGNVQFKPTGNNSEYSKRHDYLIGSFVEWVCKSNNKAFGYIENIVKGYMIASSMYIHNITSDSIKEKFKNTTFYFDTSFLVYALGYAGLERKESCTELLKLLKGLGADLKCFKHNIQEVDDILTVCAQRISNNDLENSHGLEYFIENSKTEVDIIRYISSLPYDLIRLEINIEDTPGYENYEDNIGWSEFERFIESKINYKRKDRLKNDIESIAAIYRLRHNSHSLKIEECKAVFVTTNLNLTSVTNDYFQNVERRKEFQPIISDVDLTSVAWLKSPNKSPNLPKLRIITDAYAAQCPTQSFWDRFVEEVDKLEQEGHISEAQSIELRYTLYSKKNTMSVTLGHDDKITHSSIKEILELNRREQHRELIGKMNQAETKATEYETRITEAVRRIRDNAHNYATKVKNRFVIGLKLLSIIVMILLLGAGTSIPIYNISKYMGVGTQWVKYVIIIAALILGVYGIIKIFRDLKSLNKFFSNIGDSVYKRVYNSQITKNKHIIDCFSGSDSMCI